MSNTPDAIVVGGGPAGCAAAITLHRMGYRTLLADQSRGGFKVGESLPPGIKPLLRDLGMNPALTPDVVLTSYGNQSAWGSEQLSDTDFIRDPNGCGWHVDRRRFDSAIREIAAGTGVNVCIGEQVREAKAKWVVDCTGRAASVARRRGARRIVYDRLTAVAAVFEAVIEDAESRTLVETSPDGWWYTSLTPGRRRVIVFHTDAGSAALRQAKTCEGFLLLAARTIHVRRRLEQNPRMLDGLRVAPANTTLLDRCVGADWIAAGDAAMALDPLASQGILTALYTGLKAAQTIGRMDCGDRDAASRYERDVKNVFAAYRINRDPFYRMEGRWPEHRFWKMRRGLA